MKAIQNTLKREEGQSIVVVALMIVIIMGFMGLVIDVGRLYLARQELQNYTDAATLAGARLLPYGPENDVTKKTKIDNGVQRALQTYARNVGADIGDLPAPPYSYSPAWNPNGTNLKYSLDVNYGSGATDRVTVTVLYEDAMTLERGLPKERTMLVEASREVSMIFGGLLGPPMAKAERPAGAFRGVFDVKWKYYSQADVHSTPYYWVDRDSIEKIYTASRDGYIYTLDAWGDEATGTTWAYWKYKVLAGGDGERTLCFPYQSKGACEPSVGGDQNRSYAIISSPKATARLQKTGQECEESDECMTLNYVNKVNNGDGTTTISIRVCSDCDYGLSNIAFGLPSGVVPSWPSDGETYNGSLMSYEVENPTNNPFYSIKFETLDSDGIKEGQCDLFRFIIPTDQADYYMDIRAKAATNTYDVTFEPDCGGGEVVDMGTDLIFFTSYPLSDDNNRGYLYALNSQTGEKVWSRYVGQRKYHKGAKGYTYVDSAPTFSPDGTVVYVGSRDGRLYAFDVYDGSDVWEDCDPGGPSDSCFHMTGGTVSSPIVNPVDGTIYIGTSKTKDGSGTGSPTTSKGVIHAIYPDGTEKWTWQPPRNGDGFDSSPQLWPEDNPTTLYIGAHDKYLYSLDITGGSPSLRWDYRPPSSLTAPDGVSGNPQSRISGTPRVAEEDGNLYVYFQTEYGGAFKVRDDGNSAAYMWGTWLGYDINTQSSPPGPGGKYEGQKIERRAIHISPDIADNFVYFGIATIWNRECAFQALRKDTGQIFQSFVMENDTHSTLRVAPNNWLYYASCDNYTYGVDTNPEALDSRLVR